MKYLKHACKIIFMLVTSASKPTILLRSKLRNRQCAYQTLASNVSTAINTTVYLLR